MSFSPALFSFSVMLLGGWGRAGRGTEPHRPGPREVHAVRQALPHLVAEEADADALQVLGSDLQRGQECGWWKDETHPGQRRHPGSHSHLSGCKGPRGHFALMQELLGVKAPPMAF